MKLLDYWLPPDGAGDPVGCLATTFTFDADFFSTDCLSRFLGLSGAYREGDATSDIALMIEEEERLSEARVVVLADRNCRPEARNLRWDLLAATVPGALLHAKVAVLIWQRAMRLVIGSANLTSAGYRRQLEAAVAFDFDDDTLVPRAFADSLVAELRDIVRRHTYGDVSQAGPKHRALDVLDIAAERMVNLPATASRTLRIALAPGSTGVRPLDTRMQVWRGGPPRRVVALSPFWDAADGPLPGARAVVAELAQRSPAGNGPTATFVVAVEPLPGGAVIRAPKALWTIAPKRVTTEIRSVAKDADDMRRLHAKALVYEGDDCVALMIGSSNLTAKGLGLDARSHREINVWFAAKPGTGEAKQLRALASYADPIDDDWSWDAGTDDDELTVVALPEGFADALLTLDKSGPVLQLAFDTHKLPAVWSLSTPAGTKVLDNHGWEAAGRLELHTYPITDPNLPWPSALVVAWSAAAGQAQATWPVNVGDVKLLPPVAELRDLPVSSLLNVLASSRPLRIALEVELRRLAIGTDPKESEPFDPLKRFDSSGLLLHRVRRTSAALWGLQQRLARPLASLDALEWRLCGIIGPVKIAEGLVTEVQSKKMTADEAGFLLGELALTVAAVNWAAVACSLDRREVVRRVKAAQADIARLAGTLGLDSDKTIDGLAAYMRDAFKKAAVS